MMKPEKWLSVSALWLTGLMLAVSCASEVGDIDRTQPNKVRKADLKGVWYYAATVIEAPVPSPVTFDGEMAYIPGPTKVVFDIQEKYLVVYPTAELTVKGSEEGWHKRKIRNYWDENRGDEFQEMYVGQPIAMYPIISHFDVIRKYNPQTGKQSNVIIEDTADRKWYEREYIRVDWSHNKVKDYLFMSGVSASPVDYYVQEYEEDNPDRIEITENSINFVTKMFLEPTSPESCSIYLIAPDDCVGVVAKVRHSFIKADPNDDYVPLFYPPENYQSRFSFFLTERYGYDEEQGLVISKKQYLINRWNIWTNSRTNVDIIDPETGGLVECYQDSDCAGLHDGKVHCWLDDGWFSKGHCVTWDATPPHERGVKPLVYWLSPEWPKELLSSAYTTAREWSEALKETVAWTKLYSEKGLYDVKYCETNADCTGETILDTEYTDTYPKFCDPAAGPADDTCRKDYKGNKYENGYCAQGTCRSPISCGPANPCPLGQLCLNHICHECTAEGGKCSPDDSSGWTKVSVPVLARGTFSLYYLEEPAPDPKNPSKMVNEKHFRRGVDSEYPGLGEGQVWISFAHVNPYVPGRVRLWMNGTDIPCLGAENAGLGSAYQGEELFRTPGCVYRLQKDKVTGRYIPEYANFIAIEEGSGAQLGEFNNVLLESRSIHTFALVGTPTKSYLIHGKSNTLDMALGGMRLVHGVPGDPALDFSIMGSLSGKNVTFGTFTDYRYMTQEENRVVVLPAGSASEITCFHDQGIGMCTGWRPELTEEDMKRLQEIKEALPEMFVVCENVYTGDSCSEEDRGNPALNNDCRYWYKDESGEWRNPCGEVPGAKEVKKHGDLRYSMMYWIPEDQTASPLGYGPSAADPDTGEIYYGIANVYGAVMINYGRYAKDLLDAARGKLSKEDIVSAKYIQEYLAKQEREGLYESLYAPLAPDPARMERIKKFRPEVPRFWLTPEEKKSLEMIKTDPKVRELMDPRILRKRLPELLPPSMSKAQIEARMGKIKGTWVEDLLINEEVKNAARDGRLLGEPGASDREAISPLNWMSKSFIDKQQERLMRLAEHNYMAQELAEPNIRHTAMEVAADCEKEEFLSLYEGNKDNCEQWEITRRMLNGVLEHEVGHTLGLRHNFSASTDVFNYQDEYYEIREKEIRWCTLEGPDGCVYGDYCNVFCEDDSDCLPELTGTTCQEVTSEGELVKACVDEHLDVKGWCEGPRKSYVDCKSDADCFSAMGMKEGDLVRCNRRAEETWGHCEVPARPVDGVCPPGSKAEGALCLTDDHCEVSEGKSVGKCALDGSKSCVAAEPGQADGCRLVWQSYFTVKTWCQKAGEWCDPASIPPGSLCEGKESDQPGCERLRYPVIAWGPRMKQTKYEEDQGRSEYQYSSLMDYGGTINFDIHGIGKWDKAAIRHGYGELTDVYTDLHRVYEEMEDVARYWFGDKYGMSGLFMSTDIYGDFYWYSPFFFLEDFIGEKENFDRIPVPSRKMDNEMRMLFSSDRGAYDLTYRGVPYKNDPDFWRGALGIYAFDIGADLGEIVEHSWNKLHEYYVFDAFKRERWGAYRGGNPLGYYARIMNRWFPPMQDVGRYYALFSYIFRPYGSWAKQIFANQNWFGRWKEWADETFRRLANLIFSPAPGSYGLVEDELDGKRYVNVSYDLNAPGSTVNVEIGDGKFPYTTFWKDAGYYYFDHAAFIGSFWEKLAALETLTYAIGYFLGDYMGEQVSVGVGSSIGFNDNYYTEMTNMLAGFIIGDRNRYAPYVEGDRMYPFDPLHPWEAEGMVRAETSIESLSFAAYLALLGFASLPSNFNPGFLETMFLCLKGSGDCYDIVEKGKFDDANPWEVKTIEYTDPWTRKTYVAKTSNYDPARINASYELVQKANKLKALFEAHEWGESPETDVLKTRLNKELGDIRELLDVIIFFNKALGVMSY